jgi:hypothetical protein
VLRRDWQLKRGQGDHEEIRLPGEIRLENDEEMRRRVKTLREIEEDTGSLVSMEQEIDREASSYIDTLCGISEGMN